MTRVAGSSSSAQSGPDFHRDNTLPARLMLPPCAHERQYRIVAISAKIGRKRVCMVKHHHDLVAIL